MRIAILFSTAAIGCLLIFLFYQASKICHIKRAKNRDSQFWIIGEKSFTFAFVVLLVAMILILAVDWTNEYTPTPINTENTVENIPEETNLSAIEKFAIEMENELEEGEEGIESEEE